MPTATKRALLSSCNVPIEGGGGRLFADVVVLMRFSLIRPSQCHFAIVLLLFWAWSWQLSGMIALQLPFPVDSLYANPERKVKIQSLTRSLVLFQWCRNSINSNEKMHMLIWWSIHTHSLLQWVKRSLWCSWVSLNDWRWTHLFRLRMSWACTMD